MAVAADGTGDPVRVFASDTLLFNEVDLSPDGEWFVLRTGASPTSRDLIGFRRDDLDTPVDLVVTRFDEKAPRVSPDGRWFAYVSNQAGRTEVYVRPFPDVDAGRWQVSTVFGDEAVWAHNGRELFYQGAGRPGEQMVAEIIVDPSFAVGQQQVLFPMVDYRQGNGHAGYDISPDDRRLVMLKPPVGEVDIRQLILVENFFEELKERVGN